VRAVVAVALGDDAVAGLEHTTRLPVVADDLGVSLDVGNRRTVARVAQVFPMADPERHTVKVKFDLPPGSPGAPGMYAEVMVPDPNSPSRNILVIPSAAVIQRGSLPMVRVAKGDNQSELRSIRLGEQLDADHVSVLSGGLKEGDLVYVRPRTGRPN